MFDFVCDECGAVSEKVAQYGITWDSALWNGIPEDWRYLCPDCAERIQEDGGCLQKPEEFIK